MKLTAYALITFLAAALAVSERSPLLRGKRALDGQPSVQMLQAEINTLQAELNELELKEETPAIIVDISGGIPDEETGESIGEGPDEELDEATQQYDSEMATNNGGNDYGFGMDMDPEFYGTDLDHYREPEFEDTPQTPEDNSELPVMGEERRFLMVTAEELQAEIKHVQEELNLLEAEETIQAEIEHVQVELTELEAEEENDIGGEGEDLIDATDLYNSEMEAEANNYGNDPFGMGTDPEYMGGDFESYVEPELEETPVTPGDGSELAVLDPDTD